MEAQFIFLLLILSTGYCVGSSDMISNLENCIASVIYSYFRNETIRIYIPEETCLEMEYSTRIPLQKATCFDVGHFYSSNASFVIATKSLRVTTVFRNTFIFISNVSLIEDLFSGMKVSSDWDTRVFIVVFPANQTESLNLVRNIFQQIWTKTRLMNTIVMSVDSEAEFSLYSWYPYEKDNCENPETVKLIDKWLEIRFEMGNYLFSKEKSLSNYNECPVFVTAAPTPFFTIFEGYPEEPLEGLDFRIISELGARYQMGFKFVFPPPPEDHWRRFFPDGKLQGTMRMLNDYETDIGVSGYTLLPDTYEVFTFSKVYFIDPIYWFVPKLDQNEKWKNIFTVFSLNLWIGVLVCLLFSSFFLYLLYVNVGKSKSYPYILFKIYSVTLGQSLSRFPRSSKIKLFFLSYLLYAFNIITSYQSILYGMLTSPMPYSPFESLEDIYKSDLLVYFVPMQVAYYENHTLVGKIIKSKNFRLTYNSSKALIDIAVNKKAALMQGNARMKYLLSHRYHDDHGHPMVETLPEPVTIDLIGFHFSPNHAIKGLFDSVINRLSQGGFIEKWKNDLFASNEHAHENDFLSLSLEDLKSSFQLYILFISVSFIVFLLELSWPHGKKFFRKRKALLAFC